MAEIREMVNLEQLKAQFPDVAEDMLLEAVEQEGLQVAEKEPEETVTEELAQTEEEPVTEETTPEPENKEDKKVPLKALQEERTKRQQLNAELLALKAEFEKMKSASPAQPVQPQQQFVPQQPVYQPPVAQPQAELDAETAYYAELTKQADEMVRKSLHIDDDIASLQFTDFPKYLQYQARVTAYVQQKDTENRRNYVAQQENQNFARQLGADPLFNPVYSFYRQELDEMPVKEAKALLAAEERISNLQGTEADRKLIADKFIEYRQKYLSLTNPAAQAMPPVATGQGVNKAEQAAQHPRTGMLGGGSAQSLSLAEVERLANEGKADQIPADFLERLLKGQLRS